MVQNEVLNTRQTSSASSKLIPRLLDRIIYLHPSLMYVTKRPRCLDQFCFGCLDKDVDAQDHCPLVLLKRSSVVLS
jgi:hypothetical protein